MHLLTAFTEVLSPGASILDLGCGTGRHADVLQREGFRVCGVDFDLDALSTARALYPGLAVCAARAEALPFAAAAFDAVVCVDVLHWSADAAAFDATWRAAWEALRPGGAFCARLKTREFALDAAAGWFLADRQMLEERVARDGGEWVVPVTQDGDSAYFRVRKNSH